MFVDDTDATVEVPAHLSRVVSTSVTLTGTLLAIDAPVVGSGGSRPNATGLDEHGWFSHWSKIAGERGVQSLYTDQKVDLESIMAAKPELIVVSKTGGDSAMDQYEQLRQIAPTVVIDYNSSDWRSVTKRVGEAVGKSAESEAILTSYDEKVAEVKDAIAAPAQPVDLGVYSGDGGLAIGLPTAPQAQVLAEVGITVHDTGVQGEKGRKDFAFSTKEQAVQALRQDTLLLVGNSEKDKEALLKDPAFAELPAVKSGTIVVLGDASFKLDYYAALDMLAHVKTAFAK